MRHWTRTAQLVLLLCSLFMSLATVRLVDLNKSQGALTSQLLHHREVQLHLQDTSINEHAYIWYGDLSYGDRYQKSAAELRKSLVSMDAHSSDLARQILAALDKAMETRVPTLINEPLQQLRVELVYRSRDLIVERSLVNQEIERLVRWLSMAAQVTFLAAAVAPITELMQWIRRRRRQ